MLEETDAFRRPERFERFLLACEADLRGRKGYGERDFPQARLFRRALDVATGVDVRAIVAGGLKGEAIAAELHRQRVSAVTQAIGGGQWQP
jgi:tRNA nucleotidyltransferase (CCA-adding enzyme)